MAKPSWKDAPEWAQYLTPVQNVGWLWSEKEPQRRKFGMTLDYEAMGQYAYADTSLALYSEQRPKIIKMEVQSWWKQLLSLVFG